MNFNNPLYSPLSELPRPWLYTPLRELTRPWLYTPLSELPRPWLYTPLRELPRPWLYTPLSELGLNKRKLQTLANVIDLNKRYSKIDQHLAQHFKYNGACLSSPTPFLCSQKIIPFLIQWSPSIRKWVCNFSQLWNPYTLILVLF